MSLAVLCAAAVAGCGGSNGDAVAERYQCTQLTLSQMLANAAARESFEWESVDLAQEVSALRVPGLRAVPIAAADGAGLAWGQMTAAQQDTWSAWQALDGGRVLADARGTLFLDIPDVARCSAGGLPPEPNDGLSDAQVASDLDDLEPDNVERAVDRILRGRADRKLLEAFESRIAVVPSSYHPATYLEQLEASALTGPSALAYDGDGDGYLGAASAQRDAGLRLSTTQLLVLLRTLSRDEPAWRSFLVALAHLQARQILAGTKRPAAPTATPTWAGEVGAMDGLLAAVALRGDRRVRDTVFGFRDAVIAAVDGESGVAARLDERSPSPVDAGVFRDDYPFAFVAGYVRSGILHPPPSTVRDGRVPPFDLLSGEAETDLRYWTADGNPFQVLAPARTAADWAFSARVIGCCRQLR